MSLDSWAAARLRKTRSRALASLSTGSCADLLRLVVVVVEEVEVLRAEAVDLLVEVGTSRWERRGDSSLRTIGLIEGEAVQDVEEELLLFWLFEERVEEVSMS